MLTKDKNLFELNKLNFLFSQGNFSTCSRRGTRRRQKKIQSVVEIFLVNNCVFVLCVGILPNGQW